MTTIHPSTLAIEGVSHRYGARQALIDVTFSVAPSTFTVLLGLNGAGKSTLFSLTTRLYAIQQGRIRIFGHDVARASSEALRMGVPAAHPRPRSLGHPEPDLSCGLARYRQTTSQGARR
jgi:ABC-2 type transport system ATP-binding protein